MDISLSSLLLSPFGLDALPVTRELNAFSSSNCKREIVATKERILYEATSCGTTLTWIKVKKVFNSCPLS